MKVLHKIAALSVMLALAACAESNVASVTSSSSRIVEATSTAGVINVVTARGNNNIFARSEVCQGQTWMTVGSGPEAERFTLSQRGTAVFIGGTRIENLDCPAVLSEGRLSRSRDRGPSNLRTDDQSQDRSGSMGPSETQSGPEGVNSDTGGGAGFSAISG